MLNEMLNMGGYGAYVWSTYGITFFVFGINLYLSWREQNTIKKLAKNILKQDI